MATVTRKELGKVTPVELKRMADDDPWALAHSYATITGYVRNVVTAKNGEQTGLFYLDQKSEKRARPAVDDTSLGEAIVCKLQPRGHRADTEADARDYSSIPGFALLKEGSRIAAKGNVELLTVTNVIFFVASIEECSEGGQ